MKNVERGEAFGRFIRKYRKEAGLSMDALGEGVGHKLDWVRNIEDGRSARLSAEDCQALDQELGLVPGTILAEYIPVIVPDDLWGAWTDAVDAHRRIGSEASPLTRTEKLIIGTLRHTATLGGEDPETAHRLLLKILSDILAADVDLERTEKLNTHLSPQDALGRIITRLGFWPRVAIQDLTLLLYQQILATERAMGLRLKPRHHALARSRPATEE